jgi:uncharacterized protein YbbK (DUF523 family)
MRRILVSACLLGKPVRYDGAGRPLRDERLALWQAEGRVVPVCPEMMAGLPSPREPAEIVGGGGGEVLDGRARVVTPSGADVTDVFVAGARMALALAKAEGCTHALLIDRSPSCGGLHLYDGTFSGRRVPGEGVTAALLRRHGVAVYTDAEIDRLKSDLTTAEATPPRQTR